MFNNIIDFFNKISDLSTFIFTLTLIGLTAFYSYQTRKQVKVAEDMNKELLRNKIDSRNNYAYLLNTEIESNTACIAKILYLISNQKLVNTTEFESLKSLKNSIWKSIYIESAKYFDNNTMQELTGYYFGIETIRSSISNNSSTISNTLTSLGLIFNTEKSKDKITSTIDFFKDQLVYANKCKNYLEKESKIVFRTNFDKCYSIRDNNFKIDFNTGDIIDVKDM